MSMCPSHLSSLKERSILLISAKHGAMATCSRKLLDKVLADLKRPRERVRTSYGRHPIQIMLYFIMFCNKGIELSIDIPILRTYAERIRSRR